MTSSFYQKIRTNSFIITYYLEVHSQVWKPFKNDEYCFLVGLKISFCSDIWLFILTFWSHKKTDWLERQG